MRELERFIERAVALAGSNRIELDDLPPQVRGQYGEVFGPSLAAGDSMRAWGSRYARLVFERCGRNTRRASRMLEISYHTLDAYLRYGSLPRPAGNPGPAQQSHAHRHPHRLNRAVRSACTPSAGRCPG